MGFYEDRQKRVEVFEDTIALCNQNKVLSAAIKKSIENQKIYYDDHIAVDKIFHGLQIDNQVQVRVTMNRSFQAAENHAKSGKKVCVLNFASSTSPGGGVTTGSGAQEECLCRCSTLYPALVAVKKDFHDKHITLLKNGKMNALYNDDIIYTPDVVVVKTDTVLPQRMNENEWYKVDVITCAAPNFRERSLNNSDFKEERTKPEISESDLEQLHKTRLAKIMAAAAENNAEVLILGAFGCGAFKNPPELVAKAENEIVQKYGRYFKEIEFAVFCPPDDKSNYEAFKKVFG